MNRISFSIIFSILTTIPPAFADEALTLDNFLSKVRGQNLGLKVESAKADAANAKAVGFDIPPPMVGLTQMKMQSGDSASGFEVSQAIPFPSKLSEGRSARKFEAQAQEETQKALSSEIMLRLDFFTFPFGLLKSA